MISCSDYDYIEIVCMFRYPVVLTLKSGAKVQGTAIDTVRNDNKEECVLLETANGSSYVLLDSIVQLEVSVDNPHFKKKVFVNEPQNKE
ncbi:Rho-binding antiterminator [Vibrio sinaloensis]|uniref:Rho-binding antiterminator n=1 Tax=Photobacterium sp. (strain ATCC 43367) TaxID=379097 RepID=UPI002F3F8C1C